MEKKKKEGEGGGLIGWEERGSDSVAILTNLALLYIADEDTSDDTCGFDVASDYYRLSHAPSVFEWFPLQIELLVQLGHVTVYVKSHGASTRKKKNIHKTILILLYGCKWLQSF